MQAADILQATIRLTDTEMKGWTGFVLAEVARIKPHEDRTRRLDEIRGDMDRYFMAEMDSHFRDEAPLADKQLYDLVDRWFVELGVPDMPLRKQGFKTPPWRTPSKENV